MVKAPPAPRSRRPRDPMNGTCQFPVRSVRYPKAAGDSTAATADPVFMKPLAVPEYFAAMSIGIAHIGPMTSSAQTNAPARLNTITVRSRVVKIGNRNRAELRKPATTTLRLAFCRSPVRFRIESVRTPPRKSPPTPAENTADENHAERAMSRLYSLRKNDGSQFR